MREPTVLYALGETPRVRKIFKHGARDTDVKCACNFEKDFCEP